MSLSAITLKDTIIGIKNGDISYGDLHSDLCKIINERNPKLGAYINFDINKADRILTNGIPIGIKDNINVKGSECSCASRLLSEKYLSPYDATVVKKLRNSGFVPFGRLNMDEFAMGSSTENSSLQETKNPWDLNRVPGGSSGGSAVAVASDMAIATLGSDTGGSIRQPAAFCGCVGLKPSYGMVSRYGLVAFASSLDQIGPFTKTIDDAVILLNMISGGDSRDSTSYFGDINKDLEFLKKDIRGVKIGIPKEYFGDGLNSEIRERIEKVGTELRNQGAELIDVSLPHTKYAVSTYYVISTAEASANLARFDGVRYGNRAFSSNKISENQSLEEMYIKTRSMGFGSEVKRRIALGTFVLSSGYYDAYYKKAQSVRKMISLDFQKAFEKVDVLLTPCTPDFPFKRGEKKEDPLKMYLADIYTTAVNLAGLPALSMPVGLGKEKLPVAVQLIGKKMQDSGESSILHVGKKIQDSFMTDFNKDRNQMLAKL